MESGYQPRWSDARDLDFIKCFVPQNIQYGAAPIQYTAFDTNKFPSINQDAIGLPYGCTGMSQAKLCSNEDCVQYDPGFIYNHVAPYTNTTGRNIRDVLSFICNNDLISYLSKQLIVGSKRTRYYSIRPSGILSWFDAVYVSLLSTSNLGRSASLGTPWFPEWENLGTDAILPMPDMTNIPQHIFIGWKWLSNLIGRFMGSTVTWHNSVITGFEIIDGKPYALIDSHQGTQYGIDGFCKMPPEVLNAVMELQGTELFAVSKDLVTAEKTIDTDIVEKIVSFITNLLT